MREELILQFLLIKLQITQRLRAKNPEEYLHATRTCNRMTALTGIEHFNACFFFKTRQLGINLHVHLLQELN